ncbi:hypothetical protein GCM10027597_34120 [Saccharopolyspora tripterygii]
MEALRISSATTNIRPATACNVVSTPAMRTVRGTVLVDKEASQNRGHDPASDSACALSMVIPPDRRIAAAGHQRK